MPCPDASDLAALFENLLPAAKRAELEQHLDGCDDCRLTVVALARSRASAADPATAPTAIAVTDIALAPPSKSADLAPGTHVGRYVIRGVLGRGGMGVVYTAEDPELSRDVALKIVRVDLAVVREARAMAKLSHPNVISVYDAGTHEGAVFIAMELVRGTDLRAWLAAKRRTVAEIVEVFVAAGRGLAAAHAAAIVHRDFKPDNVLVGDDGRVRVTDFGLAQGLPGDDALDGAAIGTPAYMSPEQHAGDRADPRSDQFSFSVALWEALHGERPFTGASREKVAQAIRDGQMTAPPRASRVPGSLRRLLVRGLAASPAARYPSLDALLRALGRNQARVPRRIAFAAAITLVFVLLALLADRRFAGRADQTTRASIEHDVSQVRDRFDRRIQRFGALVDGARDVPVMRQVTAHVDQSEFGLGQPEVDAQKRAELHGTVASADWFDSEEAGQGILAVADYKGRLVFTTSDRDRAGDSVRALPAVDRIYQDIETGTQLAFVPGDDPALVASGITGPLEGQQVLFARPLMVGDHPKATVIQLVPATRFLADLSPGEATTLALVAKGGGREGTLEPAVVAAALAGDHATGDDNARWFLERVPVKNPADGTPIADVVLAQPVDVTTVGLFPHARSILTGLAILFALGLIVAILAARRLDLHTART